MSDLVSQFSELAPQISNESSVLHSVVEVDGVLDQMAMDFVAGGVAHAVDFAAKAANVAA